MQEDEKDQVETLDTFLGESQFSFRRKSLNHLMVYVNDKGNF